MNKQKYLFYVLMLFVSASVFLFNGVTVKALEEKHVVTFKEIFKDKTEKASKTAEINNGEKVEALSSPAKYSYTEDGKMQFLGWFKDETFETPFDFDADITEDTTIYGFWNNKPVIETKDTKIKVGQSLDLMKLVVSATDKEDGDLKGEVQIVNFGGFNKNKEGTYTIKFKVIDNNELVATATANVTVSNKVVVTFKETFKDKSEKATSTAEIENGSKVAKPDKPFLYSYTDDSAMQFLGWFKDETFETKFDFDTEITEDTTIYGFWNNKPVITTKDASIKVGESFDLLKLVESATDKEDGDLKGEVQIIDRGGFDKNKEGTYTVKFKVIDNNEFVATATAKVVVSNEATVTFKEMFKDKTGKASNEVKVEKGSKVARPDKPLRYSFTEDGTKHFLGWFKDETFETPFDFDTEINENTTIYGFWNNKPVINVKNMTIKVGQSFDLMKLVVNATDKEDGDLTGEVQIINRGGFDKNKEGTYTVRFKVQDNNETTGVAEATITVEAENKEEPKEDPKEETPEEENHEETEEIAKPKTMPNTGAESHNMAIYAVISMIFAALSLSVKALNKNN